MELKKMNESIYYSENVKETDRPVLGYVVGVNFSLREFNKYSRL